MIDLEKVLNEPNATEKRAIQIAKNLTKTIDGMDETVRPDKEIHYVKVRKSELTKKLKYIIKKYKITDRHLKE